MHTPIYFNGVDLNGGVGDAAFARPPMPLSQFRDLVTGSTGDAALRPKGLRDGCDPLQIASAGWGMIVHEAEDPAVAAALAPLVRAREEAAGPLCRRLVFAEGDTTASFLQRHGASQSNINPAKLPYYLMIVGDPERIPFSFQADLAAYAVGRVCLDGPEAYGHYAANVTAHEAAARVDPRELVLFGTDNGDYLSGLCRRHLYEPLGAEITARIQAHSAPWRVRSISADQATRAKLSELFGRGRPGLLFTAGHGVMLTGDAHMRERYQGGLVCSDWVHDQPIGRHACFFAEDLAHDADLSGLVSFHFACFSAGTPKYDQCRMPTGASRQLHDRAFVAGLPRAMMGRPGGALAVVGHVDQAFQTSFLWDDAMRDIDHFGDTLSKIMRGVPLGHALSPFRERLGTVATWLISMMYEPDGPDAVQADVMKWLAFQDARNFILLGDPAVCV